MHVSPVQINSMNSSDGFDQFQLFEGVGLLKNYDLGRHVGSSLPPVAQPLRRVPFQLREKVDKKLDELM